MKVHHEPLNDVQRYIDNQRHHTLQDFEQPYRNYIRLISKFKQIDSTTEIIEVGTGPGWFPLMCKLNGLRCVGLEISPQLVEFAKELGRPLGVVPDIQLGNIEESDIGDSCYDVVVAQSVFEHIEHWEIALDRLYKALKPGGLLLFTSTNKFSFTSGEFHFPLYGWLPDQWRYKMRIAHHGPDIMKLGIDFHQFRYPQLRRAFKKAGFTVIKDRVDMIEPNELSSGLKRAIVRVAKSSNVLKSVVLTFADTTIFGCIK